MAYGADNSTKDAQPDAPAAKKKPAVKLPSHSERIEWYEDAEEQSRQNRNEARLDRDYYDGKQWTQEELNILKGRKQPPTVNNRIAKKINTLLGEEIEKRIDPAAKPRTPDHMDDARAATDALRFVADEQKFNMVRSAVTKNIIIEGVGGAIKRLKLVERDGEVVDSRHELEHQEYDRLFWDPRSRAHDFSDALYTGLAVWKDLDDAIEMFPGAEEELRAAVASATANDGDHSDDVPRGWIDKKRERVKIIETYFRVGDDYYVAFDTKAAELEEPARCAYEDEDGNALCSLELESCYIDAEGNRYGVVRNLRSPQDAINKRESKSLHLLSVNQTMGEDGAVLQPEELKQERVKPDGAYFGFAPDALKDGRVQFLNNLDLAQGHVTLLQEAKANIDGIGPSASNIPELPQGASGRALLARRKAAALDYGTIFDQLRDWTRRIFTLDWHCIRQTWTREKWVRVTDDKQLTGYRFVGLNRRMTRAQRFAEAMQSQPAPSPQEALNIAAGAFTPIIMASVQPQLQQMAAQAKASGQEPPPLEQALPALVAQHPLMQEMVTVNQVARAMVDIVIDEAPDTAVLAEEQFATLTEMVGPIVQARPDMAPVMARMLVQASTLPDKRTLLEAFDKPQGPSPQQQQMQAQMQQMQQQMLQLQMALTQAQVQKTQADAQLSQAKAQSELAGIGQAQAPEAPEMPSPLEHAKAQREQVNTQLDVEKTRAQVEKERSVAAKNAAQAASTAHQMMQPQEAEIIEVSGEV